MARTVFVLIPNVWTDLGTGESVATIRQWGTGSLFVNSAQDDATALIIAPRSGGEQILQTEPLDTLYVKATAAGWEVTIDI